MTDSILVWVQERRGGTPLLSLKHPLDHEKAEEACDMGEINENLLSQMKGGQLEPDVVEQVGASLAKCLLRHDAIKFELQRILNGKGAIYLRLDPALADDLPWEALHMADKGFLAFNKDWPIARVKNVRRPLKAVEPFVPPLRIFALLAPTGPNVPANDEWESLYDALKNSQLNIKLRVLVCDDDLKAKIDKAAAVDNWIECAFVPEQAGLFEQIASFAPHLIHFFCHGKASSPPFLQAGNRIDFKRNQAGTLTVEATQLRQRADPNQSVWLVTLDCCETAAQVNDGTSRSRAFASSLVLEGVPAVIGMREPLEQAVATRFCKLFYSRLLVDLRTKFKAARTSGDRVELEWTSPLFEARQELCQHVDPHRQFSVVARAAKDWTIPVLYTRPEAFVITVAADPKGDSPIDRPAARTDEPAKMDLSKKLEIASAIQQLSIQRAQLAGATAIPDSVRGSILGEIDARIAELQKELGA